MQIDEGGPGPEGGPEEARSGAAFTVDLGDTEISDEEANAILSELTKVAIARTQGGEVALRFPRRFRRARVHPIEDDI